MRLYEMMVFNKEQSIHKDGNEIEKESVYRREGRKKRGREEERKEQNSTMKR